MPENAPISELLEKIAAECKEACASEWDITKIIKSLSLEKNQNLNELREKAIELLEQTNPKAAKIYSSFHQLKVKTSKLEIKAFDRGNIIKSLLKETNVNRTIAEKIGHEVEDKIKDLKISNLTTALIREMVNAKLLEYGHESIRSQYARIGLPVFEVERKLKKGFYSNKTILLEYNLLKVIPQKISEEHFEKNIHICNISGFSTKCRAFCETKFEENGYNKAIVSAMNKMETLQKFFSEPVCFNAANFVLSNSIKNSREQKECVENFYNAISRDKKSHLFGLNLFVPKNFEKNPEKENAINLAIELLEKKPEKSNVRFAIAMDSKYQLKLLPEKLFERNLLFLNCREKEILPLGENICSEKNVLLNSVAINLPKISEKNSGKENAFFRELGEKIGFAKELIGLKMEILSNKNYLQENFIDLENSFSSIELFYLKNSCKTFLQNGSEREFIEFAEKIVSFAKKELPENIALFETKNSFLKKRFELNEIEKNETWENAGFEKKVFKNLSKKYSANSKTELIELMDNGAELVEFVPKKTG